MPAVDIYGRPYKGPWHEEGADDPGAEALAEAIARLTPQRQALLYALFVRGVSTRTYALESGRSQPAVVQQLRRTLKTLRRMMEGGSSPDS